MKRDKELMWKYITAVVVLFLVWLFSTTSVFAKPASYPDCEMSLVDVKEVSDGTLEIYRPVVSEDCPSNYVKMVGKRTKESYQQQEIGAVEKGLQEQIDRLTAQVDKLLESEGK
ncbi:MAG TPA: hypothetical protein ENH82_09960 [bacterium]|nr:hypothetical protein [bacterium]